jgi:hypothetical protein
VKLESSSTAAAAAGAGAEDAPAFTELDSFPGHSLVTNYSEYFRAQRVRLPALHIRQTVEGQCAHCTACCSSPAPLRYPEASV